MGLSLKLSIGIIPWDDRLHSDINYQSWLKSPAHEKLFEAGAYNCTYEYRMLLGRHRNYLTSYVVYTHAMMIQSLN